MLDIFVHLYLLIPIVIAIANPLPNSHNIIQGMIKQKFIWIFHLLLINAELSFRKQRWANAQQIL